MYLFAYVSPWDIFSQVKIQFLLTIELVASL